VMPMGQEIVRDKPGAACPNAGAFALAILRAEEETQTTMRVGGSPPHAVWLNGRMVWNGNYLHGYHPDADRFSVVLRKGENHVLAFSNWVFYLSMGDF